MAIMPGPALAHLKDVRLSLGGDPLFDGVDFALRKGERACLVGANGAGKSTLMRIITGATEPDTGEVAFANGTSIALVPQDSDVRGLCHAARLCALSLLQPHAVPHAPPTRRRRNCKPSASIPIAARRASPAVRCAAPRSRARSRQSPISCCWTSPPTISTSPAIEDLEERITAFRGACLIISHDRRFLERASTATLWLRQRASSRMIAALPRSMNGPSKSRPKKHARSRRLDTHSQRPRSIGLQRGVTARPQPQRRPPAQARSHARRTTRTQSPRRITEGRA